VYDNTHKESAIEKVPNGQTASERRRLAAIMFTDMVGYTALGQRNEELSLALVEEQRNLIRPILGKHGGREVKTIGDAFLVEFSSALEAVRCAYDIQRVIREYNLSLSEEDRRLHIRIGVHVGDVVDSQGDISGDAVNVASRIESLAEDGGVCITRHVYDQVQNKFDLPMTNLGSKTLKNVGNPVEVFKISLPWQKNSLEEAIFPSTRIAVLPFANISADPNDEYFSDGLTEEMIDRLSQVSNLEVIARTSAMNYKKKDKNVSEIGRELKVGSIIEGSVRKVGNKVRVTAQLINTRTEAHLWSSRYDRNLDDIFAVQSDIAENVVSALKMKLLESEKRALEKKPTEDTEAYELYLRGRFHANGHESEGFSSALEYFEKAIQKDPRFALAYVAASFVYGQMAFFEYMPSFEAISKSERMARMALEIDNSIAEAHASLAQSLFLKRDVAGAKAEVWRALELNKNSAEVHRAAGGFYFFRGQHDKAILEAEKALELDPLSTSNMETLATFSLYAGRIDRAIEIFEQVLRLEPLRASARCNFGLCYVRKGMFEAGISEVKKSISMTKSYDSGKQADLVYSLAKSGRKGEARRELSELLDFYQKNHRGAMAVAMAYGSLCEIDKALEWLEVAYNDGSGYLEGLGSSYDFYFEGMLDNPKFKAFLKKVGLEQ
jgi:adenylate cyclase